MALGRRDRDAEAERASARNLRLIAGKPSRSRLSELMHGLAAEGPFHFGSTVGFFLCQAPKEEDLDAIEDAFNGPVVLSVVPPEEQVPALSPERLAEERAAWARVAARVARSNKLRLEVWATEGRGAEGLRRSLGVASNERVTVYSGAVWSITRPGDGSTTTLAAVRNGVQHGWTFYAGQLLSPPLARLLSKFRLLEEVDDNLDDLAGPADPALAPMHAKMMSAWRSHRLPVIAGLSFYVVPVELSSVPATSNVERTRFSANLGVSSSLRRLGTGWPLLEKIDHRGVSLEAMIAALPRSCDAIAIAPRLAANSDFFNAFARHGVVVLRTRAPRSGGPFKLRIDLRVNDARVFLLDASDQVLSRGVADLAFFREPHRRGSA